MKLTDLPGIGSRTAEKLNKLAVYRPSDLLFLLPRAYQDRTNPQTINTVMKGQFATVSGQVMSIRERRYRTRRTLEVILNDGKGILILKWFRFSKWLRGNIEKRYPPGTEILASGKVSEFSGTLEMHHADLAGAVGTEGAGIVPIYPLTEGISQHTLRKTVRAALEQVLHTVKEEIPEDIRREHKLPGLTDSLEKLHMPADSDDVQALNRGATPYHRRIRFGELLVFQLGLLVRRRNLNTRRSHPVVGESAMVRQMVKMLPFDLTRSQIHALEEIGKDMAGEAPMHRLLQGDVGSGKTLVAFLAMLRVCEAGYQSVLMAPTEVLAEQHYRNISKWCGKLNLPAALLTGSVERSKRDQVLDQARSGEVRLFIGTHALIQEGVEFQNLNLAIVDEQHRFGVLQRLALGKKGMSPHFLVMTATPIPRSLSMVLYGDLDITVIDELPKGRLPVETILFSEHDRSRMHLRVSKEVERGKQVYIVYPLVEESAKVDLLAAREMARNYREKIFPHMKVGLLTGRMSSAEKDDVMARFRAGKYQVLVSTTVIEVGVDVPNASLIVVEHAERFGLFQLHQLRGRVGRGSEKATCILMEGHGISDEAKERLKIVSGTNSGFEIAEADLRIRGPGDFLGVRQAGMPEFIHSDPFRDVMLMSEAKMAALKILPEEGELDPGMAREVRKMWSDNVLATASG